MSTNNYDVNFVNLNEAILAEAFTAPARCACGTVLSRYNSTGVCNACTQLLAQETPCHIYNLCACGCGLALKANTSARFLRGHALKGLAR